MPTRSNEAPTSKFEAGIVTPTERNRSVNRLFQTISPAYFASRINNTLHYNIMEHVKSIEKSLYAESESHSESDYFQLIDGKVEEIRADIEARSQNYRERPLRILTHSARIANGNNGDSQEWRTFYSSTVRRAVINGAFEDLHRNSRIPPNLRQALMIGVESVEQQAYRRASSKREYFGVIEREKARMSLQLNEYFKPMGTD